jgi:Integrase core domain/Chromo (CHRromatin Organisation MOdifier) domain
MDSVLRKIYYDVHNPAGYSSAQKLLAAARLILPSLTLRQVQEWLSSQLTYTLHKPARRRFTRNRILVGQYNEQWQADLVDMQEFSRANNGYKYILTVIDLLSKFAYAVPLKSKSGPIVKDAFVKLFALNKPQKLQTDKGTEFKNKYLQPYLKSQFVDFFTTKNSDIKCAVVERFNRTLKGRMFKYFTARGTRRYVDVLDDLVDAYNKSKHRTTKMRPCDVNKRNEKVVFRNTYGVDTVMEMLVQREQKPRVKIGDTVRLKYDYNPFDKGYYPNWTDELYTVVKVIKGVKPYYVLKTSRGDLVDRRFYPEEIQKVNQPVFRVEKIVRRKIVDGKVLCLVKWLNHPSTENSWEPEEAIEDIST